MVSILDNVNARKSESTLEKINKIYMIALSAILAITGICFIIAAAHLYFTGGNTPYSRARVGEYLKTILVPIIITVIGVIGGAVLSLFSEAKGRKNGGISPSVARKMLARSFDVEKSSVKAEVLAQRKKRKIILFATAYGAAFIFAVSLVLAVFIPDHAVEGLNGHVVMAVLIITPSVVIDIFAIFTALMLCSRSSAVEVQLMKDEIKRNPDVKKHIEAKEFFTDKKLLYIRLSVLALGVVFVVLGIFNGGAKDVFAKAVAICTECIGLG